MTDLSAYAAGIEVAAKLDCNGIAAEQGKKKQQKTKSRAFEKVTSVLH